MLAYIHIFFTLNIGSKIIFTKQEIPPIAAKYCKSEKVWLFK